MKVQVVEWAIVDGSPLEERRYRGIRLPDDDSICETSLCKTLVSRKRVRRWTEPKPERVVREVELSKNVRSTLKKYARCLKQSESIQNELIDLYDKVLDGLSKIRLK